MNTKMAYQINTVIGTTEGLMGIGDEQIVDAVSGETIARFWNGNLVSINSSNSLSTGAEQGSLATIVLSEVA